MDDVTARIATLLTEVGDLHHSVYRLSDGEDPDWAVWYAEWLATLSELPQLLGTKPTRGRLTCLLISLEAEYGAELRPESWEAFYAAALLRELGAASA
ncbi:MAG: hypothetical protein ACREN2_05470 [Candidatus Dormibacteria bacterium]